DREHVGSLVDALAAIDLWRGVAVVENRFALKLVVVADVIEPQKLDPSAGTIRDRLRADVVEPQAAAIEERNSLADLNGDAERLALAHLEPAAALRQRHELFIGIGQVDASAVGEAAGRALEGRMV